MTAGRRSLDGIRPGRPFRNAQDEPVIDRCKHLFDMVGKAVVKYAMKYLQKGGELVDFCNYC